MIAHAPKKKDLNKPGEVLTARVRITAENAKAEVIEENGAHKMRDLVAGDVVMAPIWSALDLVNSGKGVYA